MLSEKIFKNGLKELGDCFDNFTITEVKIKTWYKYSKDLEDSMWQKKIKNCIKGCRKIPTLADILDIKGYYSDDTRKYDTIPAFALDDYDYSKSTCPKDISEKIKKIGNL